MYGVSHDRKNPVSLDETPLRDAENPSYASELSFLPRFRRILDGFFFRQDNYNGYMYRAAKDCSSQRSVLARLGSIICGELLIEFAFVEPTSALNQLGF